MSDDQKQRILVVKFNHAFHFLNLGNKRKMESTQQRSEAERSKGIFIY